MKRTVDWITDMELQGQERRAALAQAREIIAGWSLAMPAGHRCPCISGCMILPDRRN